MNRLAAVYRLAWSVVCGLIVIVGVAAGVLLVSVDVLFPLVFVATLIGFTAAITDWSRTDQTPSSVRPVRSLLMAVAASLGVVATAGYVTLAGPVAAVPPMLLCASSPVAIQWLGHLVRGLDPDIAAVTTAELCRQ